MDLNFVTHGLGPATLLAESLRSVLERSRKPTAEKSRLENVRFLSWRTFFVGKYDIQNTNEMAFKRTVTLREFSISPPSNLMRPRYCRSADARMRTQNALLKA